MAGKLKRARDRRVSSTTDVLVQLVGAQIAVARRRNRWTEDELAQRARISRATLSKIENGNLGVALGSVLEVCWLLGVPILGVTAYKPAATLLQQTRLDAAAMGMRVRLGKLQVPDDDF